MILNRIGNKRRIASDIIQYFPSHDLYIEMFFGAGGMFFSKQKAQYNICNDNDSEIFNLFQVIRNDADKLYEAFSDMPIDENLWNHWKEHKEADPIMQAIRFLFLSNFGYLGKQQNMRFGFLNTKTILLSKIKATKEFTSDVQFMNADFRDVISKVHFKKDNREKASTFIYSDPPYFETQKYDKTWTEQDVKDCFEATFDNEIKAAMSEFYHPLILEIAKQKKLKVINIGERQNLKNRKTEILILNYEIRNLWNQK